MAHWRALCRTFSTNGLAARGSTIYALSTPPGRSAIAVVRVSGPNSAGIAQTLCNRTTALAPRKTLLANIYSKEKLLLDQALVLYFEGSRSYSGDELVEFHLHGSPAVVSAVLGAIGATGLARYAEPGEFTKKAFYNGKLDLAQVEGIRDLIDADTELQRQAAVIAASGKLSDQYNKWRGEILNSAAVLTALIDFIDETEIESTAAQLIHKVKHSVGSIRRQVQDHLDAVIHGELIQEGIKVAVIGPPNAGKSAIVNKLVSRSASIVSDIPGTTRDVVHVSLDLGGFKVLLGDTAGIREIVAPHHGHDKLEALGIEMAKKFANEAQVIIVTIPPESVDLSQGLRGEIELARRAGKHIITVYSKTDLGLPNNDEVHAGRALGVSTVTGHGIDLLVSSIKEACESLTDTGCLDTPPVGVSHRTRELLQASVLPGLDKSLELLEREETLLALSELQEAVGGIGKITGEGIGVNEVLGVIFGSFCIGK